MTIPTRIPGWIQGFFLGFFQDFPGNFSGDFPHLALQGGFVTFQVLAARAFLEQLCPQLLDLGIKPEKSMNFQDVPWISMDFPLDFRMGSADALGFSRNCGKRIPGLIASWKNGKNWEEIPFYAPFMPWNFCGKRRE